MKRNLYLMSALLAAGTLGFTSCSSEEPILDGGSEAQAEVPAEVNPTYDGTSVKTQFAFNVPMSVRGTRLAVEEVQGQATPVFQGMKNIYLASIADASVTGTSGYTTVTHLADLNSPEVSTTQSSKVYKDIAIPVGTKNFLFWGESAYADAKGELNNNLNSTAIIRNDQVYFQLAKSQSSADESDLNTGKNTILTDLNAIIAAFGYDALDGATKAGDKELQDLYAQWCKPGVYWAGAKNPVLTTLTDLDNTLNDIKSSFAVETFSTGDHSVIDAIKAASATARTAITALGANFPENVNVPEGAIAYAYSGSSKTFEWQEEPEVGTGVNKLSVKSICKPASLNYFVNTPARATEKMNIGLDQSPYNTVSQWDAQWNETTGAHKDWTTEVLSSSRTVALQKNINYSVARLDLQVVADANRIEDNAATLSAAATNKEVVVYDKLAVTGILIGGQPTYVGWDLMPTAAAIAAPAGSAAPFNAASQFNQTVWDRTPLTGAGNVTTTAKQFMSTLVLDNNQATQAPVLIAVEFQNNTGEDFYGYNGLIKDGAKFYMIATLTPTAGTGYAVDGLNRVFIQDHITKVTAHIAAQGLQKAYNNIPDLRSTELELGLSVDLEWQDGLVFDVNFQ